MGAISHTSSLAPKECSLERRDDFMVGGKLWYNASLVFGGTELERETCQLSFLAQQIQFVWHTKLQVLPHEL
jgi:hypothetical protein